MITYKQYLNESKRFDTPYEAYLDAKYLGERTPEQESFIAQDPLVAFSYAQDVIKDRFPEAEETIRKDGIYWARYLDFIESLLHTHKEHLRWVKEEEITESLLIILTFKHMSKQVQEAIIKKRPDLINKIWNLDPELKEKYKDEMELSKVDI